jgi:enoyl-CoA hydratase
MTTDRLHYELRDNVAVLRMDDGKVNALSHDMMDALRVAFDRAAGEAGAVLLTGREGRLSGGFDLSAMGGGPESASRLVLAGAELLLRIYEYPRPVVVACNGHALAAGAILLLVSDLRIGASGSFKIGLNEVAIQMTLPVFAMELARARLSKRHFTKAVTQAQIFDPEAAVDAGFLDRATVPEALFDSAFEEATRLAGLPHPAFLNTKQRERNATARFIRETLRDDIAAITGFRTTS